MSPSFPLGIRTEQDFYVRLIDSMTKQVSFLILRRGDDSKVTNFWRVTEAGCSEAGVLGRELFRARVDLGADTMHALAPLSPLGD